MTDVNDLYNLPLQNVEAPAEAQPDETFQEYAAPVTDEAAAPAEEAPAAPAEEPAPVVQPEEAALLKERPDRSEAMRRRHAASLDTVFRPGVKFEVLQEVKLGKDEGKFKTPFGNAGRHGWVIREVDNPDVIHTIGASALKIGVERGNIDPLPKKTRTRKPKDELPAPLAAQEPGNEALGADMPPMSTPEFSS